MVDCLFPSDSRDDSHFDVPEETQLGRRRGLRWSRHRHSRPNASAVDNTYYPTLNGTSGTK